jgi:hypothetical protein
MLKRGHSLKKITNLKDKEAILLMDFKENILIRVEAQEKFPPSSTQNRKELISQSWLF